MSKPVVLMNNSYIVRTYVVCYGKIVGMRRIIIQTRSKLTETYLVLQRGNVIYPKEGDYLEPNRDY